MQHNLYVQTKVHVYKQAITSLRFNLYQSIPEIPKKTYATQYNYLELNLHGSNGGATFGDDETRSWG
jgi:hypothetical protein